MTVSPQKPKITNKSRGQQFRRRQMTLARKANELVRDYGAAVALIVQKNGQYYVYRSIKEGTEISFVENIVSFLLSDKMKQ